MRGWFCMTLVISCVVAACGGGRTRGAGARCFSAADCDSSECLSGGICAGPCRRSAPSCPDALACGIATAGTKQCRLTCSSLAATEGFACQAGVEVACAHASDPDCRDCGCDQSEFCSLRAASLGQCLPRVAVGGSCFGAGECAPGSFCPTLSDSSGTCIAPRPVFAICSTNAECMSHNCSASAVTGAEGFCQVAAGDPCLGTDCTSCTSFYPAGLTCAQSCTDDAQCTSGQRCVGDGATKTYWCRNLCVEVCGDAGWSCTYVNGGSGNDSVCVP